MPDQWLGMHFANATASPTYAYGTVRINANVSGASWSDIETSAGVYSWTTLDAMMAQYHDALGHDIYYQITSCPAFHATGDWAAVRDQNTGKVGSAAVPNTAALSAFVTALLTRYGTKIKYLSPWNEPKVDNPIVTCSGTITGSLAAGDTVTGATSGASGMVVYAGSGTINVRMSSPSSIPFTVGEQVRKDASNYIVNTTFRTNYYFHGTAADLAVVSKTVYQAAKAVSPSVIVTTPDFVDGFGTLATQLFPEYDSLTAWGNASDGAGGVGKQWAEALAYHFYDFEIVGADSAGVYRSLGNRLAALSAAQVGLGVSWDLYATEVGYTTSWQYYTQLGSQPLARVGMNERVTAYLAAAGAQLCIWFDHEHDYSGKPATVPAVASSFNEMAQQYNGATLQEVAFDYGHMLRVETSSRSRVITT